MLEHQGVINSSGNEKYFVFADCSIGSIGKIAPRIKTKNYLGNAYTVEFDFYLPESEMISLFLIEPDDEGKFISIEGDGLIKPNYFAEGLKGNYPNSDNIFGKWHHAAFAYKNKQIKCYIDQHRVLVIPDCEFVPTSLVLAGSLDVRVKNFKLADGGGMNMLNKILTDGKFVSHAIKFDVAKSTIKGESMGFINELAKWLKENSSIKLQICGHTDSDGDDASNLKLSEQRAEAVKKVLVSLGIDGSRLSTKGFGETKPSSNNETPEGKADNRRVEFVKT
ncbi:MAG: OmpA family protein [Bacteroidetes bacterium]|nr:OmpA family protein [Bacteroidota bacterium]